MQFFYFWFLKETKFCILNIDAFGYSSSWVIATYSNTCRTDHIANLLLFSFLFLSLYLFSTKAPCSSLWNKNQNNSFTMPHVTKKIPSSTVDALRRSYWRGGGDGMKEVSFLHSENLQVFPLRATFTWISQCNVSTLVSYTVHSYKGPGDLSYLLCS